MPRAVHDQCGDFAGLDALGPGERHDVVGRRGIQIDDALGISGANRDLLHIDIRRVEQRACLRHGHHGDGAGHVLGAKRRALQRVDGDIDLRTPPGADLLADEQHRRLVALALADHHFAIDRQAVQFAAHGIDGGLIGGLLVAVAAQTGRGHGGAFGHTHQLHREDPLDDLVLGNDKIDHGCLFRSGKPARISSWRACSRGKACRHAGARE